MAAAAFKLHRKCRYEEPVLPVKARSNPEVHTITSDVTLPHQLTLQHRTGTKQKFAVQGRAEKRFPGVDLNFGVSLGPKLGLKDSRSTIQGEVTMPSKV